MLLTNAARDAIFAGEIDLAFRRWRKPTVRTGGRLRTGLGEIEIVDVSVIDPTAITDHDAQRAGFADAESVRFELFRERKAAGRGRVAKPTEASLVYRIQLRPGGVDARVALRERSEIDGIELEEVLDRLKRMDVRSSRGPWTTRTLSLIQQWPQRRAPELAEIEGLETAVFKASVRRLKELGLTESLAVGYRLSPRGERVLSAAQRAGVA